MTIQAFVAAFEAKGAGALEELCTAKNRDYCAGYLVKHKGMPADKAEEIFRDALVVLCENAAKGKLKPSDTLVTTYLIAVCNNLWSNQNRHALPVAYTERLPERPTEPSDPFEQPELLAALRRCLGLLSDKHQHLVQLWMDAVPYAQAAPLIGMTADVAKATFYNCLKKLRRCLNQNQ
jgi:RNA polymerase sigma factor (sigma-70 family)